MRGLNVRGIYFNIYTTYLNRWIWTSLHYIEVRFSSFFSGGFITATVVNPPERKLAKRTSVHKHSNEGPVHVPIAQVRLSS